MPETLNLSDAVTLEGTRITTDGYLIANARVARTGIQLYRGREVGRPNLDMVRVYRPEDEVFAADAMASAAHRPLTNDHPDKLVDATTWKREAVGFTGGEVARDGGFLRVPLMLADADAIEDVQNGKRELSAGYTCNLDWTPGTAPDGEAYDAVQTAIRLNHIAIVGRGRAGADCRIGDERGATSNKQAKGPDMPDTNLRAVTVDGITIQTTDQGAEAIGKLQGMLDSARAAADAQAKAHTAAIEAKDGEVAGLKAAHGKALEAKDGEIAALNANHAKALEAKDGEIAALKAAVPDAAAMDALIADREAVIATARKVLGDSFDAKGQSNAAIRRAAVVKALGAPLVDGKSDDYVAAAFDTLAVSAGAKPGADPVRDAIASQKPGNSPAAGTKDGAGNVAYDAYVKSLEAGWKLPADQAAKE